MHVRLNVNGHDYDLTLEPRVTLLDALREYIGLTGTKKGCVVVNAVHARCS